jgi:hypothetical protein
MVLVQYWCIAVNCIAVRCTAVKCTVVALRCTVDALRCTGVMFCSDIAQRGSQLYRWHI